MSSQKRFKQSTLFESFNVQKLSCGDVSSVGATESNTGKCINTMSSKEKDAGDDLKSLLNHSSGGNAESLPSTSNNFMGSTKSEYTEPNAGDITPPLFVERSNATVPKNATCSKDIAANTAILELGCPLSELRRNPECAYKLPELQSNGRHTVLFKVSKPSNSSQDPTQDVFVDKWDKDFVRMPCSAHNLYPVQDMSGATELKGRWDLIKSALSQKLISSYDIEEAILTYNSQYAQRWSFRGFHVFFTEVLEPKERVEFFETTLPRMLRLALQLPTLCTQPIPLLKQGRNHTITLSQMQIACLLANAFFCTFPRRNASGRNTEYGTYPDINFSGLYARRQREKGGRQAQKLRCLLHYFRRVTSKEPRGVVSFSRRHVLDFPQWENSVQKLPKLHVTSHGTIESCSQGMLQVDFANKFIGGGVLGWGCVQEEIRFVICPELIVARLFTERMNDNECLVMTGCEQYSTYDGYADRFTWTGDFVDQTPRDDWGRKYVEVLAVDATPFRKAAIQYVSNWLERDLNKAYCGFYAPDIPDCNLTAVATGNWGCGVYKGDPRLKFLLQLLAAAEAKRDLVYFTFGNADLCKDLHEMHNFLVMRGMSVGDVWKILKRYHLVCFQSGKRIQMLYDFIYGELTAYDNDTDVEDSGSYMNFEDHNP